MPNRSTTRFLPILLLALIRCGPYPSPIRGTPHDFLWEDVQNSRNQGSIDGRVVRTCPSRDVPVASIEVQLLSKRSDLAITASTTDDDGAFHIRFDAGRLSGERLFVRSQGATVPVQAVPEPQQVEFRSPCESHP